MSKLDTIAPGESEPPQSAKELADAIAQNVLRARRERGWSLRDLAEHSGVSKALLSRIERGEANPSVETLWRIVGAIEVPFSELIQSGNSEPQLVHKGEGRFWVTEDSAMEVQLIYAATGQPRIEIYSLGMPANARSEWHSHGAGTNEHVLVSEGELLLTFGGKDYRLAPGDFLAFRANRDHVYQSLDTPIRVTCVMSYAK